MPNKQQHLVLSLLLIVPIPRHHQAGENIYTPLQVYSLDGLTANGSQTWVFAGAGSQEVSAGAAGCVGDRWLLPPEAVLVGDCEHVGGIGWECVMGCVPLAYATCSATELSPVWGLNSGRSPFGIKHILTALRT